MKQLNYYSDIKKTKKDMLILTKKWQNYSNHSALNVNSLSRLKKKRD